MAIELSDSPTLASLLAAKAPLASPTFTGTPAVPTAAPGTSTTQAASTAFVAAELSLAVAGLLDLKGSTDCSGNPNYPAASKGDAYVVSVAGKIGGASGTVVDVGDIYVASADNGGGTQAAVGTSWFAIEHNLAGALVAANDLSDVASASTARTNLGLGTADSPQFTGLNLGHDSDTTITRTGAGDIAIEGNAVYRAGGTDVAVADGGTGSSTAAGARTNLGIVIGTDVAAPVDVQVFPASGTWTKPTGAKMVRAFLIGGGGGGGGGAVVAASTAASGGGGGGGAPLSDRVWAASELSSTETVTIGAGGTGGAGGSSGGGSGTVGSAGGSTTFAGKQRSFGGGGGAPGQSGANAGGGGSGGVTSAGSAGTTAAGNGGGLNGVNGSQSNVSGGSGGGSSTSGGAAGVGGNALTGSSGGGGGGTLTAANATTAGAAGGLAMPDVSAGGAAAGTNPGGAGGVSTLARPYNSGGGGGGGGGSATAANGGAGGAGQAGGGGGGGGGATQIGFTGGSGGNGGDGRAIIVTYF